MGRVLLIEDNEDVQRAFQRVLRDHTMVTVTSGLVALETLEATTEFDIIISDYDLDGPLNGEDVFAWVQVNFPELAKKYLFSAANDRAEELCKETNTPFLAKPWKPAELRHTIATIMGAGK